MNPSTDQAGGHVAALVTIAIWGSTFVVTKVLLGVLGPVQILVLRFAMAGLVLVPFCRGWARWWGWRTELTWAVAGVLGVSLYYLAENQALTLTTATNVGLISTTIPLWTVVAECLRRPRQPVGPRVWGGSAAALLGLVVVMGKNLSLGQAPLGDLLALGAALSFTAYSLVIRGLPDGTPALVTVARSFCWGAAVALPFVGLDGPLPSPGLLARFEVWGPLLFLVLAASVAAYALWNRAIRVLGPVTTNGYLYAVPVVNTALGALMLGEPVGWTTVVGCGLIMGGVAWAASRRRSTGQ